MKNSKREKLWMRRLAHVRAMSSGTPAQDSEKRAKAKEACEGIAQGFGIDLARSLAEVYVLLSDPQIRTLSPRAQGALRLACEISIYLGPVELPSGKSEQSPK